MRGRSGKQLKFLDSRFRGKDGYRDDDCLSERARLAQRGNLVGRKIKHLAQHRVGVGAEPGCCTGGPAEAGLPRQAGENTGAIGFPKPALAQVITAHKIERGRERRCRNADAQQFGGCGFGGSGKANILDKATSDAISLAWIDLWEDRDIRS